MITTMQGVADGGCKVCLNDGAGIDQRVGTLEALMKAAEQGRLTNRVLVNLLDIEHRHAYLDMCAAIERKYTEDCATTNGPCLESGCALEGEICLEPLSKAGVEYQKACAAEWIKLFTDPRNRIDAWKH